MSELRRLGDIVNIMPEYKKGDDKIVRAYDNLGASILFVDETRLAPEVFYQFSTERREINIPELQQAVNIGDYEGMLIDKILHPLNPVICIRGRLGTGKTTTLKYVIENYIKRINCEDCPIDEDRNGALISWIDFMSFFDESGFENGLPFLLRTISQQMWNKCSNYFDPKAELDSFWNYLFEINEKAYDVLVESVVGGILDEYPYLKKIKDINDNEVKKREDIKNSIKNKNPQWYFRYLILMWRYLIETRFSGRKACAIIVLDNMDSLSTDMQANLLKAVIKSAHHKGPTFILSGRPETFDRHGLNDVLTDIVYHQGPEPQKVILFRLNLFLDDPDKYFKTSISLLSKEKVLITNYLSRIVKIVREDWYYKKFISSIAGKSIRNALVLSQGLFAVPLGEMKKRKLALSDIIRGMIRFGGSQYISAYNQRVTNPFDVTGEIDGRYLTKIRILKFVAGYGGSCSRSMITNTFSMFGLPDACVSQALLDLLRHECQLLTSNNYEGLETEHETITITEIGRGYIDNLIYNLHFIQEVIMDARVPSVFQVPYQFSDAFCRKLGTIINFLIELYKTDVSEVQRSMERISINYAKVFAPYLISLEIITSLYDYLHDILMPQKKDSPANLQEYDQLLNGFEKLIKEAKASNNSLFGINYNNKAR
ncbi:MAG: hypothetical protein IH588_16245 [Anaerolineales bacterium]|nr:hypothetical protein [Anaerolineales bacterium]